MPSLRIEHVALNVPDPVAMAAWYAANLGMHVARNVGGLNNTVFLGDADDATVIEIYNNAGDPVPDYPRQHPLRLHLAFEAPDPGAAAKALVGAGATMIDQQHLPDGTHLVMLRDPWGLAVQLCRRPRRILAADRDEPPLSR
jgi:catechol 2,3-dioxygenase-like lactoylglutathione lyase family enzyme